MSLASCWSWAGKHCQIWSLGRGAGLSILLGMHNTVCADMCASESCWEEGPALLSTMGLAGLEMYFLSGRMLVWCSRVAGSVWGWFALMGSEQNMDRECQSLLLLLLSA